MKKIEDLNYYELLEVSPMATTQEIHKAYERIRRVYDPNSIALYSLFSAEETAAIQQRIEDAYRSLIYEDNRRSYDSLLSGKGMLPAAPAPDAPVKYDPIPTQPSLCLPSDNRYVPDRQAEIFPMEQSIPAEPVSFPIPEIEEFSGPALKMFREHRGLSIRNLADITKIGTRYLEFIEEENFQKLPVRAYTRGFLILYAKALGCDHERTCADYLKRYDAARGPKAK